MGFTGQVYTIEANASQRKRLVELLTELEVKASIVNPASGRDERGHRNTVSFHVDPAEKEQSTADAEMFGQKPASFNRLCWRLGYDAVAEIAREKGWPIAMSTI